MVDETGASATISVVIVTLNEEKNLPGLFDNLRAQTDRRFDLLIIDGGSMDGTNALVRMAGDLVTYYVSERDSGIYDALNKAVRVVRTEFYLVLGADDRLAPDAIANYRAASANADIVMAGVRAGKRLRQGCRPELAWIGPSRAITSHSVGTLIRSALHEKFGAYSFRYPVLADWHFIKRALSSPQTRIVSGEFIAGEFCVIGVSNRNFARTLCELWMVQRETGENLLVQYFLFQARLLCNLGKVLTA